MPAPASAQTVTYTPNERASHGLVITRMGDTALHYWRMNGITGCPDGLPIAAFKPPDRSNDAGVSTACNVTIAEEHIDWVMNYRRPVRDSRLRRARRYSIRTVCALVTHEVGHALGLQHADSGRFPVMQEWGWRVARIPACGRAARKLVPNPDR